MNQVSDIPAHAACFACGRLSESGLRLSFETVDEHIRCRTTLCSRFQSYDGIVHGGILASIADAVMVNLVHRHHGGQPLTCHLDVRFRASVHVGEEIIAEAEITRSKHRVVWALCRLSVGGRQCVEATAAFKIEA
jgi:uncharacterized protein (TIGR00369 family)